MPDLNQEGLEAMKRASKKLPFHRLYPGLNTGEAKVLALAYLTATEQPRDDLVRLSEVVEALKGRSGPASGSEDAADFLEREFGADHPKEGER